MAGRTYFLMVVLSLVGFLLIIWGIDSLAEMFRFNALEYILLYGTIAFLIFYVCLIPVGVILLFRLLSWKSRLWVWIGLGIISFLVYSFMGAKLYPA